MLAQISRGSAPEGVTGTPIAKRSLLDSSASSPEEVPEKVRVTLLAIGTSRGTSADKERGILRTIDDLRSITAKRDEEDTACV